MTRSTTGGGSVTVSTAVSDLPSTDARIVVEPAFTPLAVVAVPDDGLTVATVVLLLVHVKVLPVIRTLSESKARAVKRRVSPSSIDAVDGDTVTRSTTGGGSVTVSTAVSDLPSTDARIVVEPAFTPLAVVAVPDDGLTVATVVLLLVHLKVLPVIRTLSASKARAVKRRVSPSSIDADDGDTDTRSTTGGGSVTVNIAMSDLPSTVASIIVVPAITPRAVVPDPDDGLTVANRRVTARPRKGLVRDHCVV